MSAISANVYGAVNGGRASGDGQTMPTPGAQSSLSRGARRMIETAAHLIDHVIPAVPTRQWVLSFPWLLRLRRRATGG